MSEGSLGEECDWKEPPDRARTGWLLPQGKGVWGQARGSILLRPTPIPTPAGEPVVGQLGRGEEKRHRHRVKLRTRGPR